jgi:hypothetical protein
MALVIDIRTEYAYMGLIGILLGSFSSSFPALDSLVLVQNEEGDSLGGILPAAAVPRSVPARAIS